MSELLISKFISKSNVRKVDKRSTDYKALRDNIKIKGVRTPITYYVDDNGDYVIVNGHQRLAIAKDLQHDKILACEVNGTGDITEEQVSVNMFTVPMTLVDASSAISKIMETEPDITRKELQLRFGKGAEWVQRSISLTNLVPQLIDCIKSTRPDENNLNMLIKISESPANKQIDALTEIYADDGIEFHAKTKISEFLNMYHDEDDFYDELLEKCSSNEWKFDKVKNDIGIDVFRRCEENHGVTHSYAHSIFAEYASDQWHDDPSFLQEVYVENTTVGQKFLKDVYVNEEMQSWGDNVCRLQSDGWNSPSKFYASMKNESGQPFSNVEIVEWDGDVFSPHLKFHIIDKKVKTKDKDGNVVETTVSENYDMFKNTYNKMNRWLYPIVESMFFWNVAERNSPKVIVDFDPPINLFMDDKNGMSVVVKWFVQETDVDPTLAAPWFSSEDDQVYHPLYNFTTKNEEPLDNARLMRQMGMYWFDKHFNDVTYEELHKLLHAMGPEYSSIDDILTNNYKNDVEFRKSYLNLMPLKALKTLIDGTPPKNKKEAVEILSADKNMPFMDKLYTVSGQSSKGCLKEYRTESPDPDDDLDSLG